MSDGITPLTPEEFSTEEAQAKKEGYLKRNLISLDMEANSLMGGMPDETVSSRLARQAEEHKPIGEVGSKILDLFQPDHGAKAQAGDTIRAVDVIATEQQTDGQPK